MVSSLPIVPNVPRLEVRPPPATVQNLMCLSPTVTSYGNDVESQENGRRPYIIFIQRVPLHDKDLVRVPTGGGQLQSFGPLPDNDAVVIIEADRGQPLKGG